MIITFIKGGLGNQMFQYAAGLALAERRRTVLKLDVSWYREYPDYEAHNRYALSCFNIVEQFATSAEAEQLGGRAPRGFEGGMARLARRLGLHGVAARFDSRRRFHPDSGFTPGFFSLPDNTFIDGLFQSERYFAPVADLLRLHFSFRYPPSPLVSAQAARIGAGPSAAVHFRRGDYARNENYRRDFGVLGLDYYRQAVALLLERHPNVTLYVFSDDISAIEREFHPPCPHEFVRATGPTNSFDKIRLMSLCDHAIISNSTFAWWGAWLNPSPQKLVIAPDPWFVNPQPELAEIVPDTWMRVPASR